MAYVTSNSQSSNTSINAFLGLNMSKTGATNLKLGESPQMVNFRITKDYKLEKMTGYKQIYEATGPIKVQWKGKVLDEEIHIYAADNVYKNGEFLGYLSGDNACIFEFNQNIYVLSGEDFYIWDTKINIYYNVPGYVPLVMISTTPEGIGVEYEPINLLTGKKHQTFSATGTDKTFKLVENNIYQINAIYIDGTEIEYSQYTANLQEGKVTFTTAPTQGTDNVDIYWETENENRNMITKNKYVQKYGLADDTRIFLYGNEDTPNRIYFSDLGKGVPNITYFPANNFIDIGSSNTAVTDISRQYDRLIISKEDETYYASYETIVDTTGASIVTFSVYPLNNSHGMVASGQGQLLDNYVTTIDSSIVMWTNTQNKDERNAEVISQRIQEWLNEKDLTKAITMDYQELKEYWLAVENQIMIYNYGNSTFYLLEIPENVTSLLTSDGVIYLGTESGKIMEFSEEQTTYDGEVIDAQWQSGYYDFGAEERRKTMRTVWLTLKPWSKTSLEVNYISDRDAGNEAKEIENHAFSYELVNYANHTYNTQRSVKPFRIKLKAKKFAFLKLTLRNRKRDEKVTVNSIAIKKAIGGEVK